MGFLQKLFGGGSGVKFKERYIESKQTPAGPSTYEYETYTAATSQQARDFLKTKSVTKPFDYIIVETHEGNWGKDRGGIYKENA